jgi:hypothetical protein
MAGPAVPHEDRWYAFRKAIGGGIFFYEQGRVYEAGGDAKPLLFIFEMLGIPADHSWAPHDVEEARRTDREHQERLGERRRKNAYHYAASPEGRRGLNKRPADPERFRQAWQGYADIAAGPYFRWPDVQLRTRLSVGNTLTGFRESFPVRAWHNHLIHKTSGDAFEALTRFLWCADSQEVSATMLRHFLFDYKEATGHSGFGDYWYRNISPSGGPNPWPGPEDQRS